MGNQCPKLCIQLHLHQSPTQVVYDYPSQSKVYKKNPYEQNIYQTEKCYPHKQTPTKDSKKLQPTPSYLPRVRSDRPQINKRQQKQRKQPTTQDRIKWLIGGQQQTQKKYFIIGVINESNNSINQSNSREQEYSSATSQQQQKSQLAQDNSIQQDSDQIYDQSQASQEYEQSQPEQNFKQYQQSKVKITQNPETQLQSVNSQQKQQNSEKSIHLSKKQLGQLVSRIYISLSKTQF